MADNSNSGTQAGPLGGQATLPNGRLFGSMRAGAQFLVGECRLQSALYPSPVLGVVSDEGAAASLGSHNPSRSHAFLPDRTSVIGYLTTIEWKRRIPLQPWRYPTKSGPYTTIPPWKIGALARQSNNIFCLKQKTADIQILVFIIRDACSVPRGLGAAWARVVAAPNARQHCSLRNAR